MTVRRQHAESVEDVRARLLARFPQDMDEVSRQFDLAVACADHLGVTLTPQMLENLVTEHMNAKAAARPVRSIPPAVPLVCRGSRSGRGGDPPMRGGRRATSTTGDAG
jgi:hypothetical protein